MRLFLIFALLVHSGMALAQTETEPSLFPDLSSISSYKSLDIPQGNTVSIPQEENQDEVAPDAQENEVPSEDDLFAEVAEDSPKKVPPSTDSLEEGKEDETQVIAIAISDVNATLTPNRNVSFCSAAFIVGNGLRKQLKSFSGTFTIGSSTKKFSFKKMAPKAIAGTRYSFVGTSCEDILKEPVINIQTCQVDGWNEKKCKARIQFVSLPTAEKN